MNMKRIGGIDLPQTADSIEQLLEAFSDSVDATARTVTAYKGNARHFLRYLQANGINKPTAETVREYRDTLLKRLKPASVQAYLTAVKMLFKFLEAEGLYPNIAQQVKAVKVDRNHKKDYLTAKQVKSVLDDIDRSTLKGKRDFAIISLMVTGGLRDIEINRANIEDIQTLGTTPVLWIQGKGRTENSEYIKIAPVVENAIADYLRARGDAQSFEPLFISLSPNSRGDRLSTRSISGIVKDRLVSAGLDSDRLTAHSLRHTAVTLSLLAGNSLQGVQQFARHTNIQTTLIYAHNINRAKLNCENDIANSIFN